MDISIIICTKDRSRDLKLTLERMVQVATRPGMDTEIVVVDNGSTDDTRHIVNSLQSSGIRLHYILEPERGQSHARNTGLDAAKGQVIVFSDDDVRPDDVWLTNLAAPILEGKCDVVVGDVRIAPHLLRPWMTSAHRTWLASTEEIDLDNPQNANGANFAFHRNLLATVPYFDPELGPGRLGFKDDTLFTLQLKHAGFRFLNIRSASVEHHFLPERLNRQSFLARVTHEGRCDAYLHWHWFHQPSRSTRALRNWRNRLRLLLRRITSKRSPREGCPPWEMQLVRRIAYLKQYAIEQRRSRNYELKGYVKVGGIRPLAHRGEHSRHSFQSATAEN